MGARLNKIPRRIWLSILLIAVGIAPMVSVVLAAVIAGLNGCEVNEAYVQPCIVLGTDIGFLLAMMGIMGWFMLISVYFLAAGLLWLAVEGVLPSCSRKSRPTHELRAFAPALFRREALALREPVRLPALLVFLSRLARIRPNTGSAGAVNCGFSGLRRSIAKLR